MSREQLDRVSPEGADVLARLRTFMREVALPRVAVFERDHPDTAFALEPDGRLAEPVYGFKREMQQLSAAAGLYCPHLPAPDGLGLGLLDCMHLQEPGCAVLAAMGAGAVSQLRHDGYRRIVAELR